MGRSPYLRLVGAHLVLGVERRPVERHAARIRRHELVADRVLVAAPLDEADPRGPDRLKEGKG